jgi:hypothetical protein
MKTPRRIRKAKRKSQAPKPPPDEPFILVLTPRVGTIETFPEPNELTSCNVCGDPLWLCVSIREVVEQAGFGIKTMRFDGCKPTRESTP